VVVSLSSALCRYCQIKKQTQETVRKREASEARAVALEAELGRRTLVLAAALEGQSEARAAAEAQAAQLLKELREVEVYPTTPAQASKLSRPQLQNHVPIQKKSGFSVAQIIDQPAYLDSLPCL